MTAMLQGIRHYIHSIQRNISIYGLAQGNVSFPNVTFSISKTTYSKLKLKAKSLQIQ